MTRACGMCSHPDRADLERRVLSGEPVRLIAADLGHSDSAVYRHVRAHLRPDLKAALRESSELHLTSFVDRLASLAGETASVRSYAKTVNDGRLLLQATATERDTLSVLMGHLGIDGDETVELLHESRSLVVALRAVLRSGHPQVSEALAAHLDDDNQPILADSFRSLAGMARNDELEEKK